jgi:hypothetical protein
LKFTEFPDHVSEDYDVGCPKKLKKYNLKLKTAEEKLRHASANKNLGEMSADNQENITLA